MPITFSVDHERRRVSTRAEGLLTFADIAAHVDAELQQRDPAFDELFDATGAVAEVTAAEVGSLTLRAAEVLRKRPVGATAIVATQPVVFGLARMYATLCEALGVRVGVFRTVPDADAWLNAQAVHPPVR